jgi:hypothetical protein
MDASPTADNGHSGPEWSPTRLRGSGKYCFINTVQLPVTHAGVDVPNLPDDKDWG